MKNNLGRDLPAYDISVKKTDDSYIYTQEGKKYIDFNMGWCVGNTGWNNNNLRKIIQKYDGPSYVFPYLGYKKWNILATELVSILPGNLSKVFRSVSGTESCEMAVQMAMKHTGRGKVISIKEAYHGHSLAMMSLGQSIYKKWYSNLPKIGVQFSAPLNKNTALKIADRLMKKDIAAYISEPIVINLGVEIPTREYFQIITDACKKSKTVFIMDEVACGFLRTGKMFASEHYDLKPDILCMGKNFGGGFGSIAGVATTERIAKSFEFADSFYSTFGWTPLNTELAIENIRFLKKNKSKLIKNINTSSKILKDELEKIKFKKKCIINIKGLACGLYFEEGDYAVSIVKKARKLGLFIDNFGCNSILLFPPIDIKRSVLCNAIDILKNSV